MIEFTGGLDEFLMARYPKEFVLIGFGHTELFTEEMKQEYLKWYLSEYINRGNNYEYDGN